MNANSVYRDSMLLMAGVLSVVVLGGLVLFNSTEEPSEGSQATLSDLDLDDALRLLMAAEYARVSDEWRLAPNVTIAIGSSLSESAAEVLRRFGHPWIREESWEENRGVPPPGTILVRELRIDGELGFVAIVIGEVAGDLACGYHIESQFYWRAGWGDPAESSVLMC
jgi:hypothetical protein